MKNVIKILLMCARLEITTEIECYLKGLEIRYQLYKALDTDQLKEILSKESIDLIVLDIGLHKIGFLEILTFIKESYPHLVRILIAEEWSKELVIKTNDLVHQIIEKSLLKDTLVDTIIRAKQMRILLKNNNLVKLINSFDELPIMQSIYIDLLHSLGSPEVHLKRISDIIEKDYALTAKVLQVSNMSVFSHIGRINSVQQAVIFLGTNVIKAIIYYLQVFSFENHDLKEHKFIKQLESHSNKVAEFAKTCAKYYKCSQETQDHTYTAALLHDIGKLIIVTKSNQWEDIVAYANDNNTSINNAEKTILGTTHAEIGAYLLSLWGFPIKVVNAVAYHHQPSTIKQNEISPLTCVHISESLINGESLDSQTNIYEYLDANYLEKLGIAGDLPILLSLFNENLAGN